MISQELRVTDKVEPDINVADKGRIKLSYPKFSAQFTLCKLQCSLTSGFTTEVCSKPFSLAFLTNLFSNFLNITHSEVNNYKIACFLYVVSTRT